MRCTCVVCVYTYIHVCMSVGKEWRLIGTYIVHVHVSVTMLPIVHVCVHNFTEIT